MGTLRWHPGNWISMHTADATKYNIAHYEKKFKEMNAKFPNDFVGYHLAFQWVLVEQSQGKYFWKDLDNFVKTVTDAGKCVTFEVKERAFGDHGISPAKKTVPDYILKYMYADKVGKVGRLMPRLDSREYVDLYLNFFRKLAERYGSNQLVTGVRGLNETALADPREGPKIDRNKYTDNIIYIAEQQLEIWEDCLVRISVNFSSQKSHSDKIINKIINTPRLVLDWPDAFAAGNGQWINGVQTGKFIDGEDIKIEGTAKSFGRIFDVPIDIQPDILKPIPTKFLGKYLFDPNNMTKWLAVGNNIVGMQSGAKLKITDAQKSSYSNGLKKTYAQLAAAANKGKICVGPSADNSFLYYNEKTKQSDIPTVYKYYTEYFGVNFIVWHDLYASQRGGGFQPFYLENAVVPTIRAAKNKINTNRPPNLVGL